MFPTDSSEVYVSRVMQKVFFEINEDGSEAAASAGKASELLRDKEEGWRAPWRRRCSAPSGLAFSLVSEFTMEEDGAYAFVHLSLPLSTMRKERI